MIEGVGCIFAVLFGNGCGNTSFSQNLGAIAITKVASRRVIIFAGILITFFGMIGKIGMLFVIIPDPIMGGIFCVMFAIITGVGISNLQYVNLNSSRNIFIIGFSLFMGLCIPSYLQNNPDALQTGSEVADQILGILLRTNMFVGGFLGCLLDNTIPATEQDRGVLAWREKKMKKTDEFEEASEVYDLPFVMQYIKEVSCFKYLPVSPTYGNESINFASACCATKSEKTSNVNNEIELRDAKSRKCPV
ncbi:solute carrier family 23 member 2-like [Uloborus diversus]|uniref:solute carrier family 23 member 2-like n=1 Tax=Uloborus diversus TaxID=327109 RepID=UPI002409B595|nr:solute carrier family 23 member 2-like [Uloborus diversus]